MQKLLGEPFSWAALKRALKAAAITIEAPGHAMSLISTVSLEQQPIPLDVKIVLLGEREHYFLLARYDPEFDDLFKVVADFETEVRTGRRAERDFVSALAGMIAENGLRPFGPQAVGEVMRRAVRLAGDRTKISIHRRALDDLLREANFLAGKAGAARVGATHVKQAIAGQVRRLDRVRDRDLESIDRDIVMIGTSGSSVGQINGLSVLHNGRFCLRPADADQCGGCGSAPAGSSISSAKPSSVAPSTRKAC